MKSCTKFLIVSGATAGLMIASVANAQYYGQPLTGAGSTVQPSQQWQLQQRQWQAQSQQYYYQPAPSRPATPQTQYMYPDSSLRSMGFPPVVTKLSPQAIDSIPSPSPIGCAFGARNGAGFGGTPGAVVGCAAGAFGMPTSRKGAAGSFFRPETAY
jgi:hypothetical protein